MAKQDLLTVIYWIMIYPAEKCYSYIEQPEPSNESSVADTTSNLVNVLTDT